MELRIFVEPQQGATYDDQLAVARSAELLGFGAFFRSDHYQSMGSVDGLPGPTDSWVTLGALARETSTIRLGTLVTSATFRFPGPLAIAVAQVDHMSGGRVEFGLGAGWFGSEHAAYAIPFPDLPDRFTRFEETLKIVTGLWDTPPGQTFSFAGDHYTVTDSPALPKPMQRPRPPIILGGAAKRRGAALAAAYADEFNAAFVSVSDAQAIFDRIDSACRDVGREPQSMIHSAALVVCAGPDSATVRRRADRIGREVDELRDNGLAGSADEIVAKLATYKQAGISRVYLQILDMADLAHLEYIASAIAPHI